MSSSRSEAVEEEEIRRQRSAISRKGDQLSAFSGQLTAGGKTGNQLSAVSDQLSEGERFGDIVGISRRSIVSECLAVAVSRTL